jgi:hypothetical protein
MLFALDREREKANEAGINMVGLICNRDRQSQVNIYISPRLLACVILLSLPDNSLIVPLPVLYTE